MDSNRLFYCDICKKNVDKYYYPKHILTNFHIYGFNKKYKKIKRKKKDMIKFEVKNTIIEF